MILLKSQPIKGNLTKSGIYFIQNKTNGKVYIGSTLDFSKRWHMHRKQLKNGNHANIFLQRSFNKYPEQFEFGILELCNRNELIIKEQFYSDLFQSYDNKRGYNIREIVNVNLGVKVRDEVKHKISQSMKGKKQSLEHAKKQCEARRGRKNTLENKALQSEMKCIYSKEKLLEIIEDINKKIKSSIVMETHGISPKTYYKLKNKTGYHFIWLQN
jgi:group I intron endonuclease